MLSLWIITLLTEARPPHVFSPRPWEVLGSLGQPGLTGHIRALCEHWVLFSLIFVGRGLSVDLRSFLAHMSWSVPS